jgi:hypothetical protein
MENKKADFVVFPLACSRASQLDLICGLCKGWIAVGQEILP